MAKQLHIIANDLPPDPDAQATVTDFLDYTEYLPSDLIRSLTLVKKLDELYLSSADEVHQLSAAYASLPNASSANRPSPQALRQQISQSLDFAISARESSYAEASRLYDMVDRHYNRLTSIISKLHALPKPPSRDPTPVPQARSPQINRAKAIVKDGHDGTPPPRIRLRLEGPRATGSAARSTARPRCRNPKITIPGEVLPPPNPESSPPVTDSEHEFGPSSPAPLATSRVGATSRSRSIKPPRVRISKIPNMPRIKAAKGSRPPRPPGAMGTNVHSAVAGISTSNALSLLSPPPPDAKPGSEHAPWMRLTEWEMAKLRKRMKKNAIWSPSETMIRRELSDAGRGPENYRSSKAKADALGEEFIDEDKIATTAPGKPLAPGEISADSLGLEETQLSNRGMKLNEAKKLKREIIAREQAALAAAEAEQAAKRLGDIGSTFKSLFAKPAEGLNLPPAAIANQSAREFDKDKERKKEKEREKEREKEKQKEREREKDREREREKLKEIERRQEKAREHEKKRERERELELEKEREQQMERAKELERVRQIAKDEQQKLELEKENEENKGEGQNADERESETESLKASVKKRKREATPQTEAPPSAVESSNSPTKSPSKRRRAVQSHPAPLDIPSGTKTSSIPLAPAAPSPPVPITPSLPLKSPTDVYKSSAPSTRSRRLSLTLKGPAPPTDQPPTRSHPSSRPASRRGSTAGPPSATIGREHLRRRSATPATAYVPIITAAGRRSKRPAPGPVTNSQDGGAAVSEGRRKNAPRKRGSAAAAHARKQAEHAGHAKEKEEEAKTEEEAAGEDIDPDEPRYCVCGDVSFGTMICCENTEVSLLYAELYDAFWCSLRRI